MIPVAAQLLGEGNEVTFGGSERQLSLIRSDMPGAQTLLFPGFTTKYSRFLPMWLYTIFRAPAFFVSIIKEHFRLRKIIDEHQFELIISDNRMGLWTGRVKTVYITHMIRIPMPALLKILEPLATWIHRQIIHRFSECWIPDNQGDENLSGRLSHEVKLPRNARYIGILSKYSICKQEEMVIPGPLASVLVKPWAVLILSGPEPQRGLLRKNITGSWGSREELLVIFEGEPGSGREISVSGQFISVPHLPPAPMAAVIKGSVEVISRSGYTTIMELASLGVPRELTTLIPTPGQTEQEYLARF